MSQKIATLFIFIDFLLSSAISFCKLHLRFFFDKVLKIFWLLIPSIQSGNRGNIVISKSYLSNYVFSPILGIGKVGNKFLFR